MLPHPLTAGKRSIDPGADLFGTPEGPGTTPSEAPPQVIRRFRFAGRHIMWETGGQLF